MSARTLQAAPPFGVGRIVSESGLALLLSLAALAAMFHVEAMAAYQVWNESTAYSHCFFVLPIALYLAWDRRQTLGGLRVEPLPWLSLLAAPGLVAWLVAERMGIMEGRQLVALSFAQLLFLVVFGWRLWWALSAPLLYLYFLVPFGAFLTPVLQKFTLDFSLVGLTIIGIPFYADEFLIDTPSGRYYVAEACAGLRFLIASIAFGALYSFLIYRSLARRAAFIVASIIIPIIANGFRAMGIVVLGHYLGSAEAAGADHILYGWLFFSIVILLLILAGMPFREDQGPPPVAVPEAPILPGVRRRAMAASIGVLLFAGTGAATAAWLDGRGARSTALPAPALSNAAGCMATGPATIELLGSIGQRSIQEFMCGRARLTVTAQVFSSHANPSHIIAARRTLGRETADEVETGSLAIPDGVPSSWRLAITTNPATIAATNLWLNGQPSRGGFSERIEQARNSVVGATAAPVLLAVELHVPRSPLAQIDRERGQELLRQFISGQRRLSAEIGAIAAAGGRPAP